MGTGPCERCDRGPRTHHPQPSPSYAGGLYLLPRVVAGPNERTAFHVTKAELHADLVEATELLGSHVPIERDMAIRRTQILAERENVDVHRSEVLHYGNDLFVRLAHAEDDPRLG